MPEESPIHIYVPEIHDQIKTGDFLKTDLTPFQQFKNERVWPLYASTIGMRFLHALAIKHITNIHEGDHVLELGAGYPPWWKMYSGRVGDTGRFVAVDKSRWVTRKNVEFLTKGNRNPVREEVLTADAERLPTDRFPEGSFDKVIASNLTNRPNFAAGLDYALGEASRVLKDGGQIYISWSSLAGLPFGVVRQYKRFLEHQGFVNIKLRPGLPDGISLRWNWFIIAQKPQSDQPTRLR